jgi:hypothetical protein
MAILSPVPADWRFVGGRRNKDAVRRFAVPDRRRRLVNLMCRLKDCDKRVTQRQLAARLRVPLGRLLGRW